MDDLEKDLTDLTAKDAMVLRTEGLVKKYGAERL